MNLSKYKEEIEYIIKVEENNQRITVLNKENKRGKRIVQKLKKQFRGGIDGWNEGAAFVGLLPFGSFSIKLTPNENGFYMSYDTNKEGAGLRVPEILLIKFLKGLGAFKK